jgi:hypothetical protein
MAGTITAASLDSGASSTAPLFKANGTEIGTLCRAWVNFDGTGTVAIRASFNVSSITDNGTGNYTINFTTAMPDANYAIAGTTDNSNGVSPTFVCLLNGGTATTSAVQFTTSSTSANYDNSRVNVSVFR